MSGLDIDTRSDIYSLGVLLYELLAGSTPFDPKDLMASGIDAMRKTIREKEPQRPSTRLATLGADQLTTTAKRRSADTSKLVISPMPGLVVSIEAVAGETVREGEVVCVIEAMKMQNIIRAEHDGVVKSVNAEAGDSVAADEVLVEFA